MNQAEPERMQCMEVWGGNQATDRAVETPGLKTWVFSRPYRQAAGGGDVYYLSSCASGRITRMLLADVSGHGEVVSKMAEGLRDLMRRNVNFIRQKRFVRAMNQQFGHYGEFGSFATALVSTFFAPTKTFTLCNAGHPPPLLYRADSDTWTELHRDADDEEEISDTPLGIVPEADYCQMDVRLQPGDMVLSFTDSVTESTAADGEQIGRQGILDLVRGMPSSPPDELIDRLAAQLSALDEGNLQQDDTTILLCQATGEATPVRNSLLAPFRLFRPVKDRTTLG